jgi:hypothetical protein
MISLFKAEALINQLLKNPGLNNFGFSIASVRKNEVGTFIVLYRKDDSQAIGVFDLTSLVPTVVINWNGNITDYPTMYKRFVKELDDIVAAIESIME